jgi:2Fe-2S ferredoxin
MWAEKVRSTPSITFVQPGGAAVTYDLKSGQSLMKGAVDHDVDGIRAECGGAAACATCQVVIKGDWATKVPAPKLAESSMLDDEDLGEGRRLSCQIEITDDLDGLTVDVWTG